MTYPCKERSYDSAAGHDLADGDDRVTYSWADLAESVDRCEPADDLLAVATKVTLEVAEDVAVFNYDGPSGVEMTLENTVHDLPCMMHRVRLAKRQGRLRRVSIVEGQQIRVATTGGSGERRGTRAA
jgi:hypothetical protein